MNDLIHAAQSGDTDAFAVLMHQHYGVAMRVAQQILCTHEAAEDAVQDAMIKVWRALPGFEDGNFRSWLLRIVKNTCYDYLKRERSVKRKALSLDELLASDDFRTSEGNTDAFHAWMIDSTANVEEAAIQRESVCEMMALIGDLLPWHRCAVEAVILHEMTYEEAGVALCLPPGTVKSRVSRGRAVLRERMK